MLYGTTQPEHLTHSQIRSWLASLKDEGMSARSINRKISSLKSYFKFQIRAGRIKQTPMAKVISPKNEKRLPAFVAEKEIKTLFNHVDFGDDWQGRTDRLVMMIFYHTGMRLSEVIGLKDAAINFQGQSLKVLGKGNKERILPLSRELTDELRKYRQERKAEFPDQDAWLFLDGKGRKLAPKRVYTMVRSYLSLVTTIDKKSPHILRHTFATQLMNNGADLNAVKELLGHSSLAATQIYTHNNIEKLKDIYKKAHPKA